MEKEALWQKAWFFGLGLVDFTRAKIEAMVAEMIKRGEINQPEGSQAVEEILARMETAQEAFYAKVGEMVSKVLHETGVFRRLQDLEKRLSALEREHMEMEIEGRQGAVDE